MATLVASSRNYAWRHPSIYEPAHTVAAEKLLLAIYEHAKRITASNRVEFKRNRYFYAPSDKYTSTFIRFKNYKK